MLFSHPKDFTPVCTTELGYMASIKPEFDRRDVKIIGLSVDPVDRHTAWASDIEETQGTAPNYPIISDADFNVSKLYGMLPADVDVVLVHDAARGLAPATVAETVIAAVRAGADAVVPVLPLADV